MNRRRFLATSIAAIVCTPVLAQLPSTARQGNPALRAKIAPSIEKGLDYLKKAQKPGGFWSSQDYPGLTGLVVQAFATAPGGKHKSSSPVRDGLKFIRDSAKPDGGIYNKGMGNYNTSIALTTLLRAGSAEDERLIEGARKYLIGAQAANSADPAHDGGFGYEAGGSGRMSRPDMDNTVFTIEALALYRETHKSKERPSDKDLNWQAAIDFVSRCQNLPATNKEKWASDAPAEKGGFVYSPGGDKDGTHSYGSMSYAGLLSLLHAEVKKDDERVKAAVEWLSRRFSVDENPGQGAQGLYYYFFVMAKALAAAGITELQTADGKKVNWRESLANKLLALQKPDGSWASDNARWMEKDPVLVTTYVVLALNILHGAL
jgi:squalene-hopene/tetraprenyl-beta-curcumene cyclase